MAKINWNALTATQKKLLTKQKAQKQTETADKNRKAAAESNKVRAQQTAAQQLEESRQYVEDKKQKQTALAEKLATGNFKSPYTTEQTLPATAVTTNTSYHDSLAAIISDLDERTKLIDSKSEQDGYAALERRAAKQGLASRADLRTKTGGRVGLASVTTRTQTLKKLATPSYLLQQAREHLDNSDAANKAGDVFTSGEYFSKAGDSIVAALKHLDTNFSRVNAKGQKIYHEKYGDVFRSPDFGDPENELRVNEDTHDDVHTIVNGFADHIVQKGLESQRIQTPEVATAFRNDIGRDYSLNTKKGKERTTEERTPSVELPRAYAVLTKDEKEARAVAAASRRDSNKRANAQKRNNTFSIAPSLESDTPPEDIVESYTTPDTGEKKTTTPYHDFNMRWKRAQVQEVFDQQEKFNEKSARAAGRAYVPKTFIGSPAWENPDKWHKENAIKQHWLRSDKANKPEDFESSEAKLDPVGYISAAEKAGNPVKTTLEPTRNQLESWARNTRILPKASTTESILFPKSDSGPRGDSLQGTSLLPFLPNRNEEKNAEANNELDTPENVNKNQLVRSRKQAFGFGLGTAASEVKDEVTGKTTGTRHDYLTDTDTDEKTPVERQISDTEALSGETVPEAAPSGDMVTRSLNSIFSNGGNK